MKKKTRDKIIVVSDVHIGDGRSFHKDYPSHPYEWLSLEERQRFLDFLRYLEKREDVKELVLLGDIFETWLCPIDEIPPTPEDILTAEVNQRILNKLDNLYGHHGIKVSYITGNHDMSFHPPVIMKYFHDISCAPSRHRGNIFMQHGHQHSMFNAPDPVNDLDDSMLPLGYYMSRVVATRKAHTNEPHVKDPWGYFDDVLESLGPETLASCVWEAVLEECCIPEMAKIVMSKDREIGVGEVRFRYQNLFKQWVKLYGLGEAARGVLAETGHLGMIADRICRKSKDINIVVLGHSHRPCVDLDRWPIHDRIYANPGAWVGSKAHFLELEVTKTRDSVRLYQWQDRQSRPKLIKKATLIR